MIESIWLCASHQDVDESFVPTVNSWVNLPGAVADDRYIAERIRNQETLPDPEVTA